VVCNKSKLSAIMADIIKYYNKYKIRAVFIDHFHLMSHPRADRQGDAMKLSIDALARLSKKLGICIYVLAQLNRSSDKSTRFVNRYGKQFTEEKEPRMADIRECGAIEENADLIWLLHCPESNSEKINIIVAKNRNGSVGRVTLGCRRHCGQFYELYY